MFDLFGKRRNKEIFDYMTERLNDQQKMISELKSTCRILENKLLKLTNDLEDKQVDFEALKQFEDYAREFANFQINATVRNFQRSNSEPSN
ncbi:MAG: hypothetical protein PVF17_00560 [Ignavibacteria bacterium]